LSLFLFAADQLHRAMTSYRRSVRTDLAFASCKQTIADAWAALPLNDLNQCPLCLVPLAAAASTIRLPGCVHAICSDCAAQVVIDLPAFLDCLLCTRTSIFLHPPSSPYLALSLPDTPVPCAKHADHAATAYCHTCQATTCTSCSPHPSEHTMTEAADPDVARARLRRALHTAFAAVNELVTRGAEAEVAITRLVSSASLARSLVGTSIAAVQAQLQKRRIAHLASMHEQMTMWEAMASAKAAALPLGAATSSLLTTGDAPAPTKEEDGDVNDGDEANRQVREHAPATTTTAMTDRSLFFSVADLLLSQWQTTLSALHPQMVIVPPWSL
jgi:hypothetical protein